ncbi:alpha/beta hydrolase [Halobacillus amylolyticus]|uniref:Alpha/beta hydrolase-fold protein n=1 Tax=Halobacillus amylolyticus TaxID=2932259 RepID=A0ABY4H9D1_9BACI|nr:alpha/beta hydrolase-fold protein [Halobacillus amylolyticus]UOR11209.1 alpha/beta hydrolase-fold protein [Halobacillus amylolyticus]
MLEKFKMFIPPFGQERMIRIYLPTKYYKENIRFPVLYMHDGQNVFEDHDAIGGVSLGLKDYLDDKELDVIVVAIDTSLIKEDRVNEYCPWAGGEFSKVITGKDSDLGGKGGGYIEFIINELKPLIDHKYRTLEHDTSMAGISLGGLITTYAACCYPDTFSKVGVLSSAFWRNQEEIEKLIHVSDLSKVDRFYLDCGTRETRDDWINSKFFACNQSVYEMVSKKVAKTKFEIVEGAEHHYSFFQQRVSDVIAYLFPGSSNER